jgi:hypothetical protein
MRFFYKKRDFLQLINIPKPYPIAQIYSALNQMINDNTEYITDKYGRTGYLVNIGDYYLFQPSELNYHGVSIYDRSTPLNFKHEKILFEIKDKSVPKHDEVIIEMIDDMAPGKNVITTMFDNYKLALNTSSIERGNKNWYQHCGIVIRKMKEEGISLELLETFLIEHIVDSLMMDEKVNVLNYLFSTNKIEGLFTGDQIFKRFIPRVKSYLMSKIIVVKNTTAIVMFNGPSSMDNLNIFVLNGKRWLPAEPEDKLKLQEPIMKKYIFSQRQLQTLNKYVGFIGFETNRKYMVYKVKDTTNTRSTGFRCDQSGKESVTEVLNNIEEGDKYSSKQTKDGAFELCVRQEFTLRNKAKNESINENGTTWFLDTETAIMNEFEKKEKPDKK